MAWEDEEAERARVVLNKHERASKGFNLRQIARARHLDFFEKAKLIRRTLGDNGITNPEHTFAKEKVRDYLKKIAKAIRTYSVFGKEGGEWIGDEKELCCPIGEEVKIASREAYGKLEYYCDTPAIDYDPTKEECSKCIFYRETPKEDLVFLKLGENEDL